MRPKRPLYFSLNVGFFGMRVVHVKTGQVTYSIILDKDKIILFYEDSIANPMACFQNGPWFAP